MLMRKALARPPEPQQYRNGIPVLPRRGGPRVTLDLVNKLRDELP